MLKRMNIGSLIGLAGFAGSANAGPALPAGGSGQFDLFTNFLQDLVDFLSGPFGTAAVIVIIIGGVLAWSYAPKEGVMGWVMRAAVAAIVIFNVGAWIVGLRG